MSWHEPDDELCGRHHIGVGGVAGLHAAVLERAAIPRAGAPELRFSTAAAWRRHRRAWRPTLTGWFVGSTQGICMLGGAILAYSARAARINTVVVMG